MVYNKRLNDDKGCVTTTRSMTATPELSQIASGCVFGSARGQRSITDSVLSANHSGLLSELQTHRVLRSVIFSIALLPKVYQVSSCHCESNGPKCGFKQM